MYLMDPSEGGRRRALVRDKGARAWHRSTRVVGKAGRNLGNRARGRIAELEEHERGERVPGLQGGISRESRRGWVPGSWPRSMQYVAGAIGAAALVYGASRALHAKREGRDEGHLAPNYAYLR